MNNEKTSVKLSESNKEFFRRLRLNIIRAGGDEEALKLSYNDLVEQIVKYFKLNNTIYVSMIGEIVKNV